MRARNWGRAASRTGKAVFVLGFFGGGGALLAVRLAMVYFSGCIHPQPARVAGRLAPGYALTRGQLAAMSTSAVGIPITFEHSGVFQAVDNVTARREPVLPATVLAELERVAETDAASSPVGSVTDMWETPSGNWWVTFTIDASRYEGVVWMIENGALRRSLALRRASEPDCDGAGFSRGLSLTHIAEGDNPLVPLEVSLCSVPARPACYVYHSSFTEIGAETYKRSLLSKAIRDPVDAKMAETEAPKSLIEQALDALGEEQRTIVAARLTEMCKRVDEATEERKKAEQERDNARQAAEEAQAAIAAAAQAEAEAAKAAAKAAAAEKLAAARGGGARQGGGGAKQAAEFKSVAAANAEERRKAEESFELLKKAFKRKWRPPGLVGTGGYWRPPQPKAPPPEQQGDALWG